MTEDSDTMKAYEEICKQIGHSWAGLRDKPEENISNTTRALWLAACGQPVSAQMAEITDLPGLERVNRGRLQELVEARLSGVPLSYLTGRQRFMGMDFLSSPQAMIPRQETEILGRAALSLLRQMANERESLRVMDLCTGSGNLLLALVHSIVSIVSISGVGADISPEAIELAVKNARHFGLDRRVEFRSGDLFSPFEATEFYKEFDLITCNPPYISQKALKNMEREITDFEPRIAFDGGPFGIQVLTRFTRNAPRFLKAGSWICFEVGAGQGEGIVRMLRKIPDYDGIETFTDNDGVIRVLTARI
jgi:release factor glutamine methyltransferase